MTQPVSTMIPQPPSSPSGLWGPETMAPRASERPLRSWERELVEALASPDGTGQLTEAIAHLVVTGSCDCCHSFDLRDTRRTEAAGWPTRYAEGTTPDLRWRFILWTDDEGQPFAVEEATGTSGPVPRPQALWVSRPPDRAVRLPPDRTTR